MPITLDVQKLEPGSKIRLIEVDGIAFGAVGSYKPNPSFPNDRTKDIAQPFRYHCNNIPFTEAEIKAANGDTSKLPAKSVWWNGNEYKAWPYELTGVNASSDGQTAEPVLRVANIDGTISTLCYQYDDLVQAKVTIIDTFAHYLDARNFPAGNAKADPSQKFTQLFYIDSKTSEDNEIIEFKLASPMDLQGLVIPTRQILGLCTWACRNQYRKAPCNYSGTNYFKKDGSSTNDPGQDACSGLLEDCKARWGDNAPLPYGGFPGASLLRK